MTASETAKIDSVSRKAMLGKVRLLANRRTLVILAAVIAAAVIGVAVLNWRWLAAVGAVSVLLSTLPCLLMCGLGLCMNKFASRTGTNSADATSAVNGTDVRTGAISEGLSCCSSGGLPITESHSAQSREKTDA
jgi:uncharacterized membrane protein (Fun14 family)